MAKTSQKGFDMSDSTPRVPLNPSGLCQCGCGHATGVSGGADKRLGILAGEHYRFLKGHGNRLLTPEYEVDEVTGCWVWQRSKGNGYGVMWNGERTIRAHRVYYEREFGPVPDGLDLDHLCRNRACVNPAHLEPVTRGVNAQRGSKAKLTRPQVDEIRRRYSEGGVTQRSLAAEYGVAHTTVQAIISRTSWRDVA